MAYQQSYQPSQGQLYQPQLQSQYQYSQPMMMQPAMGMMPPNQTQCGSNARIVAIVDIVLAVIRIIFYAMDLADVVNSFNSLNSRNLHSTTEDEARTFVYVHIALAIFVSTLILFNLIDVCIACGLKKAASGNLQPMDAVKKAKCWICFQILMIIFDVIKTALVFSLISLIGFIVRSIIFIASVVIVCKFVQELKRIGNVGVMGGEIPPTPTAVTTSAGAMPDSTLKQDEQED